MNGPAGCDSDLDAVRAAYGRRSREYSEAFGHIARADEADIELITAWARELRGLVLDVGCGPGHWTKHLATLEAEGLEAEGIDPVPEFVELARSAYPEVSYRLGRAEQLGVSTGSLGGILAWYSLIHTPPDRIDVSLSEFARSIEPGGGLLLGFFAGSPHAPFDHAVTTAYRWPVERLAARVEARGFEVTGTEERILGPTRTHGEIRALRVE